MRNLACAAAFCALLSGPAWAVQINEIRIDQPGVDDDEYLELFGAPGTLLDGLSYIVIGDGTSGSGQIEMALDLTGTAISADGFFLAAEDSDTFGAAADLVTSLNFENSDNVTHLLVTDFTGAGGDDLDADDDGTLETLPWTSIIDGLALVEDLTIPPSGTEYHYAAQFGLPTVGPDGSSVPGHVFRLPDGEPFQIGSFDPVSGRDTPGAVNIPEPATCILLSLAIATCGCLRRLQ